MVRPSGFSFNRETEGSNAFQTRIKNELIASVQQNVMKEFDSLADTLKLKGVNVFIFNDTISPSKPDAIFPNNWVTFHADGSAILYPLFAPNRRPERRHDILASLKKNFELTSIVDFSACETEGKFLEGTGSIVFDHENKIAYACSSPRTSKEILKKISAHLNYEMFFFHAVDESGKEIYHTNVMMSIGEKFAVLCEESITNEIERELIRNSLIFTGHEVIEITFEQMNDFAGNMLAVQTSSNEQIVILSQRAFDSLADIQKNKIEKHGQLTPLSINTIEMIGGGSVRCMIAEIFLTARTSKRNAYDKNKNGSIQ